MLYYGMVFFMYWEKIESKGKEVWFERGHTFIPVVRTHWSKKGFWVFVLAWEEIMVMDMEKQAWVWHEHGTTCCCSM